MRTGFFGNIGFGCGRDGAQRAPRRPSARRAVFGLALLAVPLALGGCHSPNMRVRRAVTLYYMGDYPQAQQTLAPEISRKNKNFVLNNCRYGSCAIAAGNLRDAQLAFYNAYEVMNSVHTNTVGRTLGAAVVYEGIKVWKGQPYERAMAHYYLGLIYLIKNHFNDARAAFANSLFRLRAYGRSRRDARAGHRYGWIDSNFTLGYFGLGLCYQELGRHALARANFRRAEQLNPALAPAVQMMRRRGANTVIFVDYGMGPRPAPHGWYGEKSAFVPTVAEAGPVPPVAAYADGRLLPASGYDAAVDTLALAQDKRWDSMDTLRETKAVIGTGLVAGGLGTAMIAGDRNDGEVGLIGLGAAALGMALTASSRVDVRYWEMLPRAVMVVPAALTPGPHTIQVAMAGSACQPFTVRVRRRGLTVLYVRLLP